MDNNLNIDFTPIFSELFKTQAYLRTMASFLIPEDKKEEFHDKYMKNFKLVISNFIEEHPGLIADEEFLKERLK